MLFNSINFCIFFPVVVMLYFLLPQRLRWFFLLVSSCIFYMALIPIYILVLFTTITIDYFAAIFIDKSTGPKRKFYLLISIVFTCSVLFIYKYYDFFNTNFASIASFIHWNYPKQTLKLILPIGLSFHTFQSLSYVIEVYRRKSKVERHFGVYALYVMFFPQLVAGPIERPYNLLHQFYEKHSFNNQRVVDGLKFMLFGLFKKIVIADRLAIYVNAVFDNYQYHSGVTLLIASIFFTFQIYCDFSGYSDIAIGAARVMGFRLMNNFNRPYLARSISDFWHRWHISLSTWFRDYLYFPLGGNRLGISRWMFNIIIVFLISGLWHGANWTFIIWGLLNGSYFIFAKIIQDARNKVIVAPWPGRIRVLHEAIKTITIFILINLSFIFFRANNVSIAFFIIKRIFLFKGELFIPALSQMLYSIFGILFLLAIELKQEFYKGNLSFLENRSWFVRNLSYAALIITILLIGVFDGGQFIYFQF